MQETYGEEHIGIVTAETFWDQDEDFRELQLNLLSIHVVSEEFGADCFEKSILRAPDATMKMRMAKTVMEEYGHHLRFRELYEEIGVDWEEHTEGKPHLTTFDTPIESWADQMVFLALLDRAAAHQFRQFVRAPYEPFRKACQETLNEEYGHVGLGMDGVKALLETEEGRAQVEAVVPKWLRVGLVSFGRDESRTNDRFRRWGFKTATNVEMRQAYYTQVRAFITRDWGIDVPEDMNEIEAAANANAQAPAATV